MRKGKGLNLYMSMPQAFIHFKVLSTYVLGMYLSSGESGATGKGNLRIYRRLRDLLSQKS